LLTKPEVFNFFQWLRAVITNPMIIGNKYTPVHKVVHRAGSMVASPKLCFCMVMEHAQFWGALTNEQLPCSGPFPLWAAT
jgi:hypothetical protein